MTAIACFKEMIPIAIRGIQQTSLVDFPGEVCTTVFLGGCNFRCPWCHNADLVLRPATLPEVSPAEVLNLLLRRRSWVQAVCITGGEPTLAPGLEEFIRSLKSHGFKVKLDTNGSQPDVIARLLAGDLLDYVAMDIKAPPEKYDLLTGTRANLEAVKESIALIKNSRVAYEFRTTVVPGLLMEEDFLAIGRLLRGARRYVLQQYQPAGTLLDADFQALRPYPGATLQSMAQKLHPFIHKVDVRN
ncbi:anaerobic ribonucleoside-triphosphate reductase activating protein [Moorella sp. E306M]|uniref:anaerobic ribonucleoside-triphosphate reductase activating protein n=1 Tax=Moorella sp. E306M TaxID=2572683 RepID=UPI0010FFB57C|nr:anaerobic ribonucleoside-triphosphate reductase activating protein [Moorella sp. E306M]GEA18830.1 anaerobic ribonucleoside-triphosphate reductase activating protein [Moorella sp. E306M]